MAEDVVVGRAPGHHQRAPVAGWVAVGLVAVWSIAGIIFGLYGVREASGQTSVAAGPVVYTNLWQSINVDITSGATSEGALLVCGLWLLATVLLLPAAFFGWTFLVTVRGASKVRAALHLAVLTALVIAQFRVQTWGVGVPQSGEFDPGPWERGYRVVAVSAALGFAVSVLLLRPWQRRSA